MASEFEEAYEDIIRSLYAQAEEPSLHVHRRDYLISPDGTFLGNLNNRRHDPEGIFNRYSQYGSPYSNLSIFNRFGQYGSRYSNLSPFSRYATQPPKIFLNNRFVGYLTMNRYMQGAREPEAFLEDIKEGRRPKAH